VHHQLAFVSVGRLITIPSMPRNLLFLCTGNYYRSRFAELLFNHLATQRSLGWRATSAGLNTDNNHLLEGNVSPFTAAALRAKGIECDVSRSPRRCQLQDLRGADLIVALKQAEHEPLLKMRYAEFAGPVRFWHVHDLDGATPGDALAEIESLVRGLVDELSAPPHEVRRAAHAGLPEHP
jgi:protein-tyrosine phosphatase